MEKFSSVVTKQPLVGRAPFKSTEEATSERSRAAFKIIRVHGQSTEEKICSYGARERYQVSKQSLWYLPHHRVFNPNKPEKIRVVFDCAAKFRGVSLNSQLLQGPDLTNSPFGVLIRFREDQVALMADIEAMFHQVHVSPHDYDALRFLWWPNNDFNEEHQEFQMMVHLFGATSSPSCANFALCKTVDDNSDEFGEAISDIVMKNFYVDDCLKSVKDEDKGVNVASSLSCLLNRGGFRVTKWVSNSAKVIESVPEEERSGSVKHSNFDQPTVQRALGVTCNWDVVSDEFSFKVIIKKSLQLEEGYSR